MNIQYHKEGLRSYFVTMIKHDCLFRFNFDVKRDVSTTKCSFSSGDEFHWLDLLG